MLDPPRPISRPCSAYTPREGRVRVKFNLFLDDFEVGDKYTLLRWRNAIDEDDVKVISVDTLFVHTPASNVSLAPPVVKSPNFGRPRYRHCRP
ncbi:hypothetical protein NL676_003471 [Syzygium grande]|nr:hypothetical protein NL676_003471 [Syzygium grande]